MDHKDIPMTTLLELVHAINEFAHDDAEVTATVAYLVNSGKVRLGGTFAGAKIDLSHHRASRTRLRQSRDTAFSI